MSSSNGAKSWLGLIASIIAIFSFITGVEALPQLLEGADISQVPSHLSTISAILGKSFGFITFCISALLLLGLSYALSRSLVRSLFGDRTKYSVIDGLFAAGILISFVVLHVSIYEIWWGVSPLNVFSVFEVSETTLFGPFAGIFYLVLMFLANASIIEQAQLWPVLSYVRSVLG